MIENQQTLKVVWNIPVGVIFNFEFTCAFKREFLSSEMNQLQVDTLLIIAITIEYM